MDDIPMRGGRRRWLRQAVSAAGGLTLGASLRPAGASPTDGSSAVPHAATPGRPRQGWQNWAGTERCDAVWFAPADEASLQRALPDLPTPLRCVGRGLSLGPLVPSTGSLLSLQHVQGLRELDRVNQTVRVGAGTTLAALNTALHAQGLALLTQVGPPDQTLGGAVSTGSHGGGHTLPGLQACIQSLRLVTAQGETLELSRLQRPEAFEAARLSLGAVGVITEITLLVRPRYRLNRRQWLAPTPALLEQLDALARGHRQLEVQLLPGTGHGLAICDDELPGDTQAGAAPAPDDWQARVMQPLPSLQRWLGRWPALRRWTAEQVLGRVPQSAAPRQGWSHELLATPLPATRLLMSEWMLPRSQLLPCLRELLPWLEQHRELELPLRLRPVRADYAWLSPAYAQDSWAVLVQAPANAAGAALLRQLTPMALAHGGRPHWAMLHAVSPSALAALYPRFADFQAQRERLDPQGRLLNPWLRSVLRP